MKINKDSWHYKLVNRFCEMCWVNNLCPYMRRLTGILAVIVFVVPSILFGMVEAVLMVMYDKEYITWITNDSVFGYYSATCMVFGVLAWIAASLFGVAWSTLYVVGKVAKYFENNQAYQGWRYERLKKSITRACEPNIFIVWCKARHDQICPMVDFVCEEKTE